MIINGNKVNPKDIDEQFLKDLPETSETDVNKIMKYIRKTIAIRTNELISQGMVKGNMAIDSARSEAKKRFGKNWRECMLTRTLYKESLSENMKYYY